jgi:hypothetical protein
MIKGRIILILFFVFVFANIALLAVYFHISQPPTTKLSTNSPPAGNSFTCPVPKQYCRSGKAMIYDGRELGVGYRLPAQTPIYAVKAGAVYLGGSTYSKKLGGKTYPRLSIFNSRENIVIDYVFTGKEPEAQTTVKAGDELLKIDKGEVAKFGVNLLIRAYRQDKTGKRNAIPLKVSDFGIE